VLGRFLEYSIPTPDIRASLNFYAKLGFSTAEVGEAWTHPYAVVTDGRLCLGLHESAPHTPPHAPPHAPPHDQPDDSPSLTFVKPELLKHLGEFDKLGIRFEFRRLGNDVFNEIGWRDPSGHLIRLLEARTFSPSKRKSLETSLCGYFLEIALPTADQEPAKEFWERLGFVGMDEPDAALPHVSCTSDTIEIGLYQPAHLREPTLLFEVDDMPAALAKLDAAGVTPNGRIPGPLRQMPAAMLIAPEGTAILLTTPPD
jgi:catechol 2,3-dioxygenase-like lactoylglutathione lyase family enzyme